MAVKTIRTGKVGSATLRLVQTDEAFVGIINDGGKTIAEEKGSDADEVWRLLQTQFSKAGKEWFGYDGARARFLECFPGGFGSDAFLDGERFYKLDAKQKLDETVPLEDALDGKGHGPAVLRAYQATNLLSPFEKAKLPPLLRGDDGDAFVRAAARFAMGEGPSALKAMEALLTPYESAKWTVVTYLPYLWRPDGHLFLKPEVTKDFASRVDHRFARRYSAELDHRVYEDLLNMAGEIRTSVVDLGSRDMIDIQSYIWVVGDYEGAPDQDG